MCVIVQGWVVLCSLKRFHYLSLKSRLLSARACSPGKTLTGAPYCYTKRTYGGHQDPWSVHVFKVALQWFYTISPVNPMCLQLKFQAAISQLMQMSLSFLSLSSFYYAITIISRRLETYSTYLIHCNETHFCYNDLILEI